MVTLAWHRQKHSRKDEEDEILSSYDVCSALSLPHSLLYIYTPSCPELIPVKKKKIRIVSATTVLPNMHLPRLKTPKQYFPLPLNHYHQSHPRSPRSRQWQIRHYHLPPSHHRLSQHRLLSWVQQQRHELVYLGYEQLALEAVNHRQ